MVLGIPKRALIIGAILVGVVVVYALGGEDRAPGGSGNVDATGCDFVVSADFLNVREEPTTRARVVGKYEQDATVRAEPTVRNGFRKLAEGRWVSQDFLTPATDAECR